MREFYELQPTILQNLKQKYVINPKKKRILGSTNPLQNNISLFGYLFQSFMSPVLRGFMKVLSVYEEL